MCCLQNSVVALFVVLVVDFELGLELSPVLFEQ